jgi:UDP-N-acetylmuramoylalanine--D-glutamate ligase
MEVFFKVCPCPIIGVTGSDGKTTTTTLISKFLQEAGKTVHLGGNIGRPLLCQADEMKAEDFAVVELSSFQLMTMSDSPHGAVITNLEPNHLDVHRGMNEYVSAKENIFTHQSASDFAVFNGDNEITREQASRAPGRVRIFSRKTELESGVFVRGNDIVSRENGEEQVVMNVGDILLPGLHNLENYLAAIAAAKDWVPYSSMQQVARTFVGVEHRIELVRTLRGVRYYNDSIGTSPSRTIAGLRSFGEKVILIAGGYDKHIPFTALGPELIKHVKLLILCGDTAGKIRDSVLDAGYEGSPKMTEIGNFEEAVRFAASRAGEGDVVLLSPACAAFDQFRNFAERGKKFKEIVNGL